MHKHPVSPKGVSLRVWNSFYEYFEATNFYSSKYKKNVFFSEKFIFWAPRAPEI